MAIYDLGTASLAANGEVTGVGTTWKAPLTLIRVGATIVFKTEPVQIYTISEIISDAKINVYNPNSETVPAGTGYAILAHDGITVQGLAQDVAETLRYYQSRETEVADAVDAFNNFDPADFESKVTQVNTQHGDVVSIGAQVSADAARVAADKNAAASSAASASLDKDAAAASAQEAADYAASLDTQNLLRKDLALSDLTDKPLARQNLDVYSKPQLKRVLLSVDELRNFEPDFNGGQVVYVKGYYSTTPGLGGGDFIAYDGSEPDDGVFTFVTPGGIRWKRIGKKTKLEVECTGVSSSRTAEQNSEALIRLFDSLPDTGATVIVSDFYNIKYGIILPPRVSLVGVGRDSCGFIKTGNDVRVVPDRNWGSSPTASYSVDFILAIDIDQSPTGDLTGNNTRSTRICGLSLSSTAPSRVEYGIYSYISYLVRVEDVLISNVNTGYRTQDSWLQTFSNVIIDGVQDGFVVSGGGTSFDLSAVYVKNSSRWAFYFNNITYSNLNCCAVDYCYGSAYVMLGCTGVSMNGCGAEEIHGSLFEVNGSRVSLNAFRSVNVYDTGSVAAIFTNSAISFDSSFLTEFVVPSGSKYWQFNGTTINISNTVEPGAGRVSWGNDRSLMNYKDYRGFYTVIGDSTSVSDGVVTAGVINLYRSVPPDGSVTSFPVGTTWTLTTPLAGNVYKYVYTASGWKYASTLSQ